MGVARSGPMKGAGRWGFEDGQAEQRHLSAQSDRKRSEPAERMADEVDRAAGPADHLLKRFGYGRDRMILGAFAVPPSRHSRGGWW